ncbi:MAG: hypothetical protein AABY65_03610 [Nitrospirota bacterium]
MRILRDYGGREVRLTGERLEHILSHPEMVQLVWAIDEVLAEPERVVRSASDPEAQLYYRFYEETPVGGKFLCVVVKVKSTDTFILTAYLTDAVKKGEEIWPARS